MIWDQNLHFQIVEPLLVLGETEFILMLRVFLSKHHLQTLVMAVISLFCFVEMPVAAQPLETRFRDLDVKYQGALSLPLLAADQAYGEEGSRELPFGTLLESSHVSIPLHLRMVVIRDANKKKFYVGIRGTDVKNIRRPNWDVGNLFGFQEILSDARNILQDLGVFESGLEEEKIPLLLKLDQIIENYRSKGRDDPENVLQARSICQKIAQVHSVLPAVSQVCGAWIGRNVGAMAASAVGLECSMGSRAGTVLGAYGGIQALTALQGKIRSLLNQELTQAFQWVIQEVAKIHTKARKEGYQVEISGHSLGGFLASAVGAVTGDQVWTLNAPGGVRNFLNSHSNIEELLETHLPHLSAKVTGMTVDQKLEMSCNDQVSNISNIRNPDDVIAGFGQACGKVYLLPSVANVKLQRMNSFYESQHSITPLKQSYVAEVPAALNKRNNVLPVGSFRLVSSFAHKTLKRTQSTTGVQSIPKSSLDTLLDEVLGSF